MKKSTYKKILITGATGFIGRQLIKKISEGKSVVSKNQIVCLVRKESRFLNDLKIKSLVCDLNDRENLLRAAKSFDVVVHLAGVVNTPSKKEFYEKNVLATKNIIDACKANKIRKIIFASTAVVTSSVKGPYSKSKADAEKLIEESGLDYIFLRIALVYGEGDKKNVQGLIDIAKIFPLFPLIGGKKLLQPVHVSDVTDAIIKSIKKKNLHRKTYFVAGPRPITFEYLIDLIMKNLNLKKPKINIPSFIPVFFVKVYERISKNPVIVSEQMERMLEDKSYDISNTRSDLNFNPITVEEGLKLFIKGKAK